MFLVCVLPDVRIIFASTAGVFILFLMGPGILLCILPLLFLVLVLL